MLCLYFSHFILIWNITMILNRNSGRSYGIPFELLPLHIILFVGLLCMPIIRWSNLLSNSSLPRIFEKNRCWVLTVFSVHLSHSFPSRTLLVYSLNFVPQLTDPLLTLLQWFIFPFELQCRKFLLLCHWYFSAFLDCQLIPSDIFFIRNIRFFISRNFESFLIYFLSLLIILSPTFLDICV